jgi:hypothetical protein
LDDILVLVALICDIVYCVGFWIATTSDSVHTRTLLNWLSIVVEPSVIWMCRTAIIVSMRKVVDTWPRMRRCTVYVAVLFILMWIITIVLKLSLCTWRKANWQCLAQQPIPATVLTCKLLLLHVLFSQSLLQYTLHQTFSSSQYPYDYFMALVYQLTSNESSTVCLPQEVY